eukprot:TRINITY_DN11526_c0_g1_i1.p1 TRINITY_DN11526_c0_g1~~TRINITY_DN11526_c0_g1_i1.p1  ORF type:complete len:928 (+),score=313.54 TRINITY_DN11526_c0_g1_i1:69-2852(+)
MLRRAAACAAALGAASARQPQLGDPGTWTTPVPPTPPPAAPKYSKLSVPNPERFAHFLNLNVASGSKMPLSYNVPGGYFDSVPPGLKRQDNDPNGTYVFACESSKTTMPGKPPGTVSAERMNQYEFESERILATLGLDIYDGAVWTIAQSLLGNTEDALRYNKYVLWASRTLQLQNIRGSGNTVPTGAEGFCKGVMYDGACTDPTQNGACGLCYGDSAAAIPRVNALLFRMVADPWDVQGTQDLRCPDIGRHWTWNDYKPIVGENAWASFLGPLTLGLKVYGSPDKIPEDSPEFQLGLAVLPALQALRCSAPKGSEGYGSVYFCPHNAFFYAGSINPNAGSTVSVENQASLYASLKAFHWVLGYHPKYAKTRCEVKDMMDGLQSFLLSAYEPTKGYFRQGGTYDKKTQKWTWGVADQPDFAVDCQTWVSTVLGPKLIDSTFGANTTWKLWQTLKQKAGYGIFKNGTIKGVGYSLTPDKYFPSTDSTEVSPQISIKTTVPFASFDAAKWLDQVSYVIGVPPSSAKVLTQEAWTGGTKVSMVFVRVGDITAQQTAVYMVNVCNTPGTTKFAYANCSSAQVEEVFSGEWTLGAVNWLRLVAAESGYAQDKVDQLIAEADFMRMYVEKELLARMPVQRGYDDHWGILYGSARYYVPFGWWSNPVQSTASTGWAVATDMGWNPLMINGAYSSSYPPVPGDPQSCTGSEPAPPDPVPIPNPGDLPFDPDPHQILAEFFQSTGGKQWYAQDYWLDPFTYNPCGNVSMAGSQHPFTGGWNGVTCDNDGRIVELTLGQNNLRGSIPKSIGYLTHLVRINMQGNKLSGSLPDTLGKLTRLEMLQLSNNELQGSVPAALGNATKLKFLWLSHNQLSGTLPVDLKGCADLQVLNIDHNKLTGLVDGLPWDSYSNCDLSLNQFKCPVPAEATNKCYAFCM